MDRLLRGDIPPRGKCDIKTLAREAAVDRTAFYGSRPHAHLREEFETRLAAIHQAGDRPDPRAAQILRMKDQITALRQRLARQDEKIAELTVMQARALSQLAAQREEIMRLRRSLNTTGKVRQLPARQGRPVQLTTSEH